VLGFMEVGRKWEVGSESGKCGSVVENCDL